jgi:hypothetical protein
MRENHLANYLRSDTIGISEYEGCGNRIKLHGKKVSTAELNCATVSRSGATGVRQFWRTYVANYKRVLRQVQPQVMDASNKDDALKSQKFSGQHLRCLFTSTQILNLTLRLWFHAERNFFITAWRRSVNCLNHHLHLLFDNAPVSI